MGSRVLIGLAQGSVFDFLTSFSESVFLEYQSWTFDSTIVLAACRAPAIAAVAAVPTKISKDLCEPEQSLAPITLPILKTFVGLFIKRRENSWRSLSLLRLDLNNRFFGTSLCRKCSRLWICPVRRNNLQFQ